MQAVKTESFDPMYRLKEVESIIRKGRGTIYRLIQSGDLPAVKCGGSTLVTKSAIDRYIASIKPVRVRN